MKKSSWNITFKDSKIFLLSSGLIVFVISIVILVPNIITLSFILLDYLCLIAFGFIYSRWLEELRHKESSLRFFDTLLFQLRWGASLLTAVEQANVQLESQQIRIDPNSDFVDIECRKLSLGSLSSTFNEMMSDFKKHKPVIAKASFIKSKIKLEIEQVKTNNECLISYNEIMISRIAVQLLTLITLYFYNSFLSLLLDKTMMLTIELTFLFFDLFIIFLLVYYRKEIL